MSALTYPELIVVGLLQGVSELFPVDLRGIAIALFYAIGTATGGLAAPALFGALIESGRRDHVLYGYLLGAALGAWSRRRSAARRL